MTDTPNLGLPFIEASQAQKHVTHNEALRILDAAIQIAVLDITRTTPPASPAESQRHVVAVGATGAWAGQGRAIATWQDGAWAFLAPRPGWCVWSVADDGMMVFDGMIWRAVGTPLLDSVAHLGINTSADSSNLLSVKSNAALFTALAAAAGGSGDVRLQLSRESAAKTASVVFSDNYSGRAEFGLVGSDMFKLKVSADGVSFVEAFNIDQSNGNLTLPRGLALTGVIAPAQITANQNDYNPAGLVSATVLQISSDAARSMSGLATGAEGRIVSVINVGSQPITLLDENASSSAANRFTLAGDLAVAAKQAVLLRYDGTAARWQAIARPAASGVGTLLAANNLSDLSSAASARANLGVRELLTANRTYYVRTDGSNANSGLANTPGGAFLTIQKAIDVAATLDIGGFNVTINVGAGTYTGGATVSTPWVGKGNVFLVGDTTTPANVLLNTNGIAVSNFGILSVGGFKISGPSQALVALNYGEINVNGKMEYGATGGGQHMYTQYGGVITVTADYTISGASAFHWLAKSGGRIACTSRTITVTGAPTFTIFVYSSFGGLVEANGNIFSGSAIGQRFQAETCGGIVTGGAGINYLPGNAAGVTTLPGWYQ